MEQITKIKTAIHINQTYRVTHEGDWRKLNELTTALQQVAALIEYVRVNPQAQPKPALRRFIKGERIVASTRKNENVFSTPLVTIYSKTINHGTEHQDSRENAGGNNLYQTSNNTGI
jgi:hypothetical protein